jgi:hypothetical protein
MSSPARDSIFEILCFSMKTPKSRTFLTATFLTLIVCFSSPGQPKFKKKIGMDAHGRFTGEGLVCGETVNTPELDQVRCGGQGCQCIADGKWCFKPTSLVVKVANSITYQFSGPATVQCIRDNQGSCEWNALGAPDRFTITLNNPDEIRATILTNSRNIGVRLCAPARYYPPGDAQNGK